jgi:hypothetical protein
MNRQLLCVSMLAGVVAALPSPAAAQFPPPPPPPAGTQVQDRWPQPAPPPTQRQQPQTQPQTQQPPPRQAQPAPRPTPDAPKPAPKPRAAATPAHTVTCGGVFNKDATHLKLAIKYDSRNIVFGEVDGPDGSKIKATILYPNEAKRRLEVIWNNDAARTDLSLVVINGQSQWMAPKGLKLGTSLAALEKANGRPFKLTGLGDDGSASVLGWEGGALTSLPGGCKVGIRLVADSKAPTDARGALAGRKELVSNDANLRAVKPTIAEILIGY